MSEIVSQMTIESRIYHIRGKKVMIDRDLAALYGVETRSLNQAVIRNIRRFPEDFMFQLTADEMKSLRSQFVISNIGRGGRRYLPYAFTENGVAMLSSVLKSEQAVMMNIQIMRAFVRMRNLVSDNAELRRAIETLERRVDVHDRQIQIAFAALKSLLQPPKQITEKHYSPDEGKKMGFGKTGRK